MGGLCLPPQPGTATQEQNIGRPDYGRPTLFQIGIVQGEPGLTDGRHEVGNGGQLEDLGCWCHDQLMAAAPLGRLCSRGANPIAGIPPTMYVRDATPGVRTAPNPETGRKRERQRERRRERDGFDGSMYACPARPVCRPAFWRPDSATAAANAGELMAWLKSERTLAGVADAAERARTPEEREALEECYLRWLPACAGPSY